MGKEMSAPMVCCILLVNGRPEMTRRAIASFQAQTYERKRLIILDTGASPVNLDADVIDRLYYRGVWEESGYMPEWAGKTIGWLRNKANEYALSFPVDLIAHFDSDDWSHPRRLEEQVALLEASGKMCVGYRELLFWDTRPDPDSYFEASDGSKFPDDQPRNEAWVYRNLDPRWAAGASFLYRRELWEQQPFDDAPHEDQRWWCTPLVSRNCVGVSAIPPMTDPRMICQMHPGGTEQIPRDVMLGGGGGVWLRALSFDKYCERTMQL